MAGDWIPFYTDTPKKIEIARIARETGRSRHEVIGLLAEFWCWVQSVAHARLLERLKWRDVCEMVGGDDPFWNAVEQVGWARETDEGIEIVNADDWLEKGAKSRLLKAKRQKRYRESKENDSEKRGACVDGAAPRKRTPEESRVEKENNTPIVPKGTKKKPSKSAKQPAKQKYEDDFERFWKAFPRGRKTKKADANKAWKKAIRHESPEVIIQAAGEYADSEVAQGRYVQGPAPWLNGACWDDDREAWKEKDTTEKADTAANHYRDLSGGLA